MSAFSKSTYPPKGVSRPGVITLYHRVTLGSSGAIASQDSAKLSGIVAAKTATKTGRYTLTINGGQTARKLLYGNVAVIGTDDAAYTTANGRIAFLRDDDLATDGTIEVQLTRTDTGADAEAITGAVLLIKLEFTVSSVGEN